VRQKLLVSTIHLLFCVVVCKSTFVKIDAYGVRNYRSFLDRAHVELRPLTLFFGYNSAGKSALLRALPLIAASCNETNGTPVAFGSPAARGATFQDLLPHPKLGPQRELTWDLSFQDSTSSSPISRVVAWTIRDLPELRRQVVEKFEIRETTGMETLRATWLPSSFEPRRLGSDYELSRGKQVLARLTIHFQGLIPSFISMGQVPIELQGILESIQQSMENLRRWSTSLQWLTSVRDLPRRSFSWRGSSPALLSANGEGAADVLAYDSLEEGQLIEQVSSWYQKHLGLRLRVVSSEDQFRLILEPLLNSPIQVNLVDAGEGLLQVLPVLVASARSSQTGSNSVMLVEEPESHLHPRLHAALAETFCELAASEDPPNIVLETHSENLLLRVQLAVASGQLTPDRVVVYWIRQLEDGRSQAERIDFDQFGRPSGNWPPGVFQEDLAQARQLISKQRERLTQ